MTNYIQTEYDRSVSGFNESLGALESSLERLRLLSNVTDHSTPPIVTETVLKTLSPSIESFSDLASKVKELAKKTYDLIVKAFTWLIDKLSDLYRVFTDMHRTQLKEIKRLRKLITDFGSKPYFREKPRKPLYNEYLSKKLTLASNSKLSDQSVKDTLLYSETLFKSLESQSKLVLANNNQVIKDLDMISNEKDLVSLITHFKDTSVGKKTDTSGHLDYYTSPELVGNQIVLCTVNTDLERSGWVDGKLGLELMKVKSKDFVGAKSLPVLDETAMLSLLKETEYVILRMRDFNPDATSTTRELRRFLDALEGKLRKVENEQALSVIRSFLINSNKETIEAVVSCRNYYTSLNSSVIKWIERSISVRLEGKTA